MSPSLPDIAIDARSPSHSSLVCIIRQTDIAAAAAVATAPVAVAVASSPPTQYWAGAEDEEKARRGGKFEARTVPIPLTQLAASLMLPLARRLLCIIQRLCNYSPAELSHKASAELRRDAPPPGMQGLHEW